MPIIEFQGSTDLNFASSEAANVADVFEIVREDDDCEGTGDLILTEVEKVHALDADLHADDGTSHAPAFADVLASFVNLDAVGGGKSRS